MACKLKSSRAFHAGQLHFIHCNVSACAMSYGCRFNDLFMHSSE